MRNLLVCSLVFMLSFSCHSEVEKPADLIPRDDMKYILKELYIYRQVRNLQIKKNKLQPAEINLGILNKNQLSLEQFQSSYNYYLLDNAAYDEILDEIKEELEAELPEKDSVDIQKEVKTKKEIKPLDSVKKKTKPNFNLKKTKK